MVVTLGALDLNAHENPRDLTGHLDGPGLVGQRERHGAVLVVAAGGRDHARDDRVPGRVRLQLLGEPVFKRVKPDPVQVLVGGVELDHFTPVVGPVAGVLRAVEQRIDQPGALVLGMVVDERLDLGRRRWMPDHVEIDAAHELDVAS